MQRLSLQPKGAWGPHILDDHPVIILGAPFRVYQVTLTNTPAGRREVSMFYEEDPIHEAFRTLHEGDVYLDMDAHNGYAIGYYEPLYYGSRTPGYAAVQYQTKEPMVLLDLREYPGPSNRIFYAYGQVGPRVNEILDYIKNDPKLRELIDGWIVRNDGDTFYEIHLFNPRDFLVKADLVQYTPEEIRRFNADSKLAEGGYPYNREDNEIIEDAILNREHLEVIGNQYKIGYDN